MSFWTAERLLKVMGYGAALVYAAALVGAASMVVYTVEPWRSIGVGVVGGLIAGAVLMVVQWVSGLSTYYKVTMAVVERVVEHLDQRRASESGSESQGGLDD